MHSVNILANILAGNNEQWMKMRKTRQRERNYYGLKSRKRTWPFCFFRDEEAEKLEKESLYVNAYQRDNVSCMTRIQRHFFTEKEFSVKIRCASRSWLQPPSAAQQCPSAQNVYYPGANIAQLLAQCRTWFQKEFEISSCDVLPHVFLCQMFAFGSEYCISLSWQ